MKTKTSLWLSICTIVLCIGVMTFGVYSAISANLNIGGTLGFNMHDCMITVSGTIQNVAKTSDNWVTAEPYTKTIERTIMGGESKLTTNMTLDPLYFYNDQDLIFSITFTNIHTKAVDATFPAPTVGDGSKITVLDAGDNQEYTAFPYTPTLTAAGETGCSVTVMFALHLVDTTALFSDVNFNWTGITFEEWSLVKSSIITNTSDGYYVADKETTYYYIEMGTNPKTGEKLRWVPFAEYDTETQTYKAFLKTSEPQPNKTYYFISEYILDVDNSNYGMSYNFYDDDTDSKTSAPAIYYNGGDATTKTNYPALSVNTNDYSVSNMRAYLNSDSNNPAYRTYSGNTANAGSAQNYYPATTTALTGTSSFLTRFGISGDSVYNMIQARPLDSAQNGATFSLYSDIATDGTANTTDKTQKKPNTLTSTTKTINGNNITTSGTDEDKLWCLSYYEAYNLLGNQTSPTTLSDPYRKSFKLPTVQGTPSTTTGYWWLRTPYSSNAHYAYVVHISGDLSNNNAIYAYGARPAFQIQIP